MFRPRPAASADDIHACRIAYNGKEIISKNQGATAKTIDHITKFLENV
jgi:hypothetical protein